MITIIFLGIDPENPRDWWVWIRNEVIIVLPSEQDVVCVRNIVHADGLKHEELKVREPHFRKFFQQARHQRHTTLARECGTQCIPLKRCKLVLFDSLKVLHDTLPTETNLVGTIPQINLFVDT
jgi:hypothetical protein